MNFLKEFIDALDRGDRIKKRNDLLEREVKNALIEREREKQRCEHNNIMTRRHDGHNTYECTKCNNVTWEKQL